MSKGVPSIIRKKTSSSQVTSHPPTHHWTRKTILEVNTRQSREIGLDGMIYKCQCLEPVHPRGCINRQHRMQLFLDGLTKDHVTSILATRSSKRLHYLADFGFDCVVSLKHGFWKDSPARNKCIMPDFMLTSCWYFGIWKVETSISIISTPAAAECIEVIWPTIISASSLIIPTKLIEPFTPTLKDARRNGFVSNSHKAARSTTALYDYHHNFAFYSTGKVEVLCWVRNGPTMINGTWSSMIC